MVWPHGAMEISNGWSVHSGDDPAYAEPGFDDSGWEKVDLHRFPAFTATVARGHARWYRRRVHLPQEPGARDAAAHR